ncbi:winged helix-turn-helix domain-containing protein [Klebsiella quasipneumoniae]|uniref:GntR family transcriptional regulator n=1 Tax=Klebsiella quasipneumoniae TaxID=1463165 RepID=UPI00201FF4E4|nr:winged helix-turn-helix domain-containing protein [Klebsiella quasipneumoniae]MCL8072157.1 winged helix-turn-helix domain-containing protein [Klebsiella quasipneumoniae]
MKISALSERISQKIIGLVDNGEITPGSHLSVPKLAETFDVSRSPVREALVYLEQKGVLLQKQNRGFFVKDDYTPQVDTKQELSEEIPPLSN